MFVSCVEKQSKIILGQRLMLASFGNLFIVALLGVLLRAFPFFSSFPLHYKNILHGHSHFAFCGWVLPVLLSLIINRFPALQDRIPYHYWRNTAVLVLVSAYGILFTFPVQGYGPLSIVFSTLSIVATIYLALIIWQAAEGLAQTTSILFLKWGLLYGCLSAVGPFSIRPLVALGHGNSPLYFDAIYFYLHFQYNGLFTFLVLALLYRLLEKKGVDINGKAVFSLFNYACIPAFALSVLWNEPPAIFYWIGGAGATLQLAGVFYLLKDVSAFKPGSQRFVLWLVLFAFILKSLLQLLSALPSIALLAFQNRNFVIAYLHLVLLGFVSLFVFSIVLKRNTLSRFGLALFLFSFVTTELLLIGNASSGLLRVTIPYFVQLLLFFSLFFPLGVALMIGGMIKQTTVLAAEKGRKKFTASVPQSA